MQGFVRFFYILCINAQGEDATYNMASKYVNNEFYRIQTPQLK